MVLEYSIAMFISQLVYTGFRTLNMRYIAENKYYGIQITSSIVHLSYLVSIAVGAVSIKEIIEDFRIDYLPIIAASLAANWIGNWIALKLNK